MNHSAKNAACLCPGHKYFDADKHDFMDKKILGLLAVGAVVPMPDGELPEVLTRLSLAPQPGKGDFPQRTGIREDQGPDLDPCDQTVVSGLGSVCPATHISGLLPFGHHLHLVGRLRPWWY